MTILILIEPFVGLRDFLYGLTLQDAGTPAFYQVVKQLDKEGIEVVIVTPTDQPVSKTFRLWNHVTIVAFRPALGRDPLKLGERIRLGGLTLNHVLRIFGSVFCALRLSREVKFDLIVGHWEFATLAAYIVGRIRRVRNVSRLYGSNLLPRTGGNLNWKSILLNLNRVIPFVTPAALYICTQDGTQADKVAAHFRIPKEKFVLLLNGVELDGTPVGKNGTAIVEILFIGHFQSWKNPMRVMELVPDVIDHTRSVRFTFIGSGAQEKEMREFIRTRQLESFVFIEGRMSQEKKNRFLAKADIYVSFYSFSNLSNTLLEALAYGKAILTVNEGDTSLVVRNDENAIVLPKWDRRIAIEKLLVLIDQPEKRRELGRAAREWAVKNLMSWEERAKIEIRLYEDLAQAGGLPS